MVFKTCFISTCPNNTDNNPKKLFMAVPIAPQRRKRWFDAVNFDTSRGLTRKLNVCEDHFNLEEDAENWVFFKIMGKSISFKKHVVPHLNLQRTTAISTTSQFTDSDRKIKVDYLEQLEQSAEKEKEDLLRYNNRRCSNQIKPRIQPPFFPLQQSAGYNNINDNVPLLSSQTSTTYNSEKCSVENCESRADKDFDLIFYLFPKVQERYINLYNDSDGRLETVDKSKAWKKATNVKVVGSKTKVCSRHFTKDDYVLEDYILHDDLPAKRWVLKEDAVPSCNLPGTLPSNQLILNEEELEQEPCEDDQDVTETEVSFVPNVHVADPIDTHFVEVTPLPAERNCDDNIEPHRCRQCCFTTNMKLVLAKHKQFKHNPKLDRSSDDFRIAEFSCKSCRKCDTFSAMIMSQHHGSESCSEDCAPYHSL